MLTSNYNKMGNAKKTAIHIPELNAWSVFIFIHYLLFQDLADLQ